MKSLVRNIVIVLLVALIVPMGASFISADTMNHAHMGGVDCFGVGCGLIQHISCDLSQSYVSTQCEVTDNQDITFNLVALEYRYTQLVFSPPTPPPQFSLV